MSSPTNESLPSPPYNPALRDLVEDKRQWAVFRRAQREKEGFRGWNERGYLPHRDEPGLTQLVTFRLADSFPGELRSEWEGLLSIEDNSKRRRALESYLDKGRGRCFLRQPQIAKVVEDAICRFDGSRYELLAWVIMPNHVHVLFKICSTPMSQVLETWKKHLASKANRLLKRRGAFWQADYWDTYMRDAKHEKTARKYVEANPAKAKLVLDPKAWPWGSARFCDEFENLNYA